MTAPLGGPFECPSGLHGNVWCTCPAPKPTKAMRFPGTCHGCWKPFDPLERMVTIFEPPRFQGSNLILHEKCAVKYLKKNPAAKPSGKESGS
jgi:hypothetical protein